MPKYAILYHPGHNRVYYEASLKLSLSEFGIVAHRLSTAYGEARHEDIGGIDYLTFQTESALSESDVDILSDLSFAYALYKISDGDGTVYLQPIRKTGENFIDESMGTILKYTGKTNELFTRMMINVAYYSLDAQAGRTKSRKGVALLDPLAGKGTTLYEGLIKGFDVYGIEISDNLVNEAYHYVKRYLETARYKFGHEAIKLAGPNKSYMALKHTFTTAKTKEDLKRKDTRTIEFIAGDALYAADYYKNNTFAMIVGDLPYGVQHGNITKNKQTALTRNPKELLLACLPAWLAVLKPQGVMVLAWNSNVLPRSEMEGLFADKQATVINDGYYAQFAHRVDQSIERDIIVARKTR